MVKSANEDVLGSVISASAAMRTRGASCSAPDLITGLYGARANSSGCSMTAGRSTGGGPAAALPDSTRGHNMDGSSNANKPVAATLPFLGLPPKLFHHKWLTWSSCSKSTWHARNSAERARSQPGFRSESLVGKGDVGRPTKTSRRSHSDWISTTVGKGGTGRKASCIQ